MPELPVYSECTMKRQPPSMSVNQEFLKSVGENFRVLPTFEIGLFEYKYRKHYSLNSNELLKCRWKSFVERYHAREIAPFTFVDLRDSHFHNSATRLIPQESLHNRREFRYKLKVGPGVDFRGQMPIPQDLLMKRGSQKQKTKGKVNTKPEKGDEEEKKDETDDEKE